MRISKGPPRSRLRILRIRAPCECVLAPSQLLCRRYSYTSTTPRPCSSCNALLTALLLFQRDQQLRDFFLNLVYQFLRETFQDRDLFFLNGLHWYHKFIMGSQPFSTAESFPPREHPHTPALGVLLWRTPPRRELHDTRSTSIAVFSITTWCATFRRNSGASREFLLYKCLPSKLPRQLGF